MAETLLRVGRTSFPLSDTVAARSVSPRCGPGAPARMSHMAAPSRRRGVRTRAHAAEGASEAMTTRSAPVTGERRQLINVAYRMLGSLADAEDAVQEAY